MISGGLASGGGDAGFAGKKSSVGSAVDAAMPREERKPFPVVAAVGIESELRQVALAKAVAAELKVETEI
ncbi:hypothetical protein A2U01_0084220 [Trifolium medium]|uniref:Uncharacterized protein n=1 Tax=Trifolium medium TaxID=97028 RepID=A0A392TP87_9FABA|nr:hypothetical protein [Trifolium medium]